MPGPHPSRDAGLACKDCPSAPMKGARRCKACALTHNARETARRAERRARGLCHVCGGKGARVDGETLSTCPTHREYYRARAAG